MSQTRLEQLLAFLEAEPDDPFLLYALATEYAKNDIRQSLFYYEKLLQEHPEYLPTYYHAARLYEDLDQRTEAESTFLQGISLAKKQQDSLALRELQNAYQEFQFE